MTAEQHARSLFDVLPAEVRHLVILGGGCLRAFHDGTAIKDIDCFFRNQDDYHQVADVLSWTPGWVSEVAPNRVRNFRSPTGELVSLIGFSFGQAVDHLERFDFRCCGHVAVLVNERVVLASLPGAEEDCAERLLYVLNNNGTERTIRRIRHYVEDYGYSLHPDQLEQGDLFDDADEQPDGHLPQGVHTPPREPEYVLAARRRVRAIPITPHGYP